RPVVVPAVVQRLGGRGERPGARGGVAPLQHLDPDAPAMASLARLHLRFLPLTDRLAGAAGRPVRPAIVVSCSKGRSGSGARNPPGIAPGADRPGAAISPPEDDGPPPGEGLVRMRHDATRGPDPVDDRVGAPRRIVPPRGRT